MAIRNFQRGSSVFSCRVCDRKTRHTNRDQSGCGDICAECFELAGFENAISDYGVEDSLCYRSEACLHLKNLRAKGVDIATVWATVITDFQISDNDLA